MGSLRDEPHLSASAVSDYIECGLLYKFGRVDRIPPEFTSDALVFGTVIHMVLETYYLEKKDGVILSVKDVRNCFEEFWRMNTENKEDIQYADGKDFDSYLLMGRELLTVWREKLPDDDFKVIATEHPFRMTIPDVPVPVIGYMDLIEEDASGTIIITDFKSAGKSYSSDEIDKNMQLLIYQMGAKQNGFKGRDILLRIDALIKTKTPKFEQYYTVRTETDERRVIRKIQSVWQGVSNGVFIPNDTSWKCKGCAYRKPCRQYLEGGQEP